MALSGLAFAFTAGVLSLLSPCGFPMLPSYVLYYLGGKTSLRKAVSSGFACTLGLVTVFSAIGVASSVMGNIIDQHIPMLKVLAGMLTILLGIMMIAEIELPLRSVPLKAPERRGIIGVYLYGVIYGLATIGCSAPLFFAVLFWAIAGGGFFNGIITFMAYALGMGLLLILTTVLVALATDFALKKMVKILPWVQKIGGIFLIVTGFYLVYFYYSSYVAF